MKALPKKTKKLLTIIIPIIILVLGIAAYFAFFKQSSSSSDQTSPQAQKPKLQANLIPIEDRPFVTLQPLSERNQLEFVIHNLPKKATSVELALEYDRNKGVMDAVLYSYDLDSIPYVDTIFLGSKSAGGHTTYHDDVIGGTMNLQFEDADYALEVPWRYSDAESSYDQLSTADAKFQLELASPIRKSKVIIMQSPGLPDEVEGEVLAGPYLISTVGTLPDTTAEVTIRIPEEVDSATIMAWDGTDWVKLATTLEGKTASADDTLYSTYVVIKP